MEFAFVTKTSREPHPFSADRPIETRDQDKLNRRRFAEELAKAISAWRGEDSLILALYGPWGMGKTSLVNMALDALKDEKGFAPAVLEFNPWQWSGHEDLATAFFDQVGRCLGGGPKASEEDRQRSKLWAKYAAAFKTSSRVISSARTLVSLAAGALLGLGIAGSAGPGATWFRALSLLVAVLGGLALGAGQVESAVGSVADFFARRSTLSDQTLAELKRVVHDSLATRLRPVVIVMDDVDRLTPDEMGRLFQLVKANADFPNLVYLLAFDRDAVARGISKVLEVSGNDYLEKIIQIGLDTPRTERRQLEAILLEGVDAMRAQKPVNALFSDQRFVELYASGIDRYLQTPRDVKRFLSTLHFMAGVHLRGDSFNVNPIDLIGIETLRVFEPSVFAALDGAKEVLTGASGGSDRDRASASQRVTAIIDRADDNRRALAEGIIRTLFPTAAWAIGGVNVVGAGQRWQRERRVCDPDTFPRYFTFSVPVEDVSEDEVDGVLQSLEAGREAAVERMRSLAGRGIMSVLLSKLRADPSRVPTSRIPGLLAALFDLSEDLSDQSDPLRGLVSDSLAAVFLVSDLLATLPEEQRLPTLREAIVETEGVHLPVYFVSLDLHRHERSSDPTLPLEELEALRVLVLEKLRAFVAAGGIASSRHASQLLYRLKDWGSDDEAANAAYLAAQTPQGLLAIAKSFRTHRYSDGRPDAFALDQIEPLLNLEDSAARASVWLEAGGLSDDESEVLRALAAAVPLYRAGRYGRLFED